MRIASCKHWRFTFFSIFSLVMAFVTCLLVGARTAKALASIVPVVREADGDCIVVPPFFRVVKEFYS